MRRLGLFGLYSAFVFRRSNIEMASDPMKVLEHELCALYKKKIVFHKIGVSEEKIRDAVRIGVECLNKQEREAKVS